MSSWHFQTWIVIPLALSVGIYVRGTLALWRRAGIGRGVSRLQLISYLSGILLIALALLSPLDDLGERLISAHMVQHEILMVAAAPLLVLGRPLEALSWGIPRPWRRGAGKLARTRALGDLWGLLTVPYVAWLLHALAIWLWHAPVFFQAALGSETIHTLQHTCFLATALLFWWVTLPSAGRQPRGANALIYLFTTMLHTEALGAILAFSSVVLYPLYVAPGSPAADALQDQHLAGLIMWVPGGLPYLVAGLFVAARWVLPSTASELGARL